MSQEGISLHLAKTNASLDVPPAHWLVGHFVSCARGPNLKLVGDHVTQTLVVDNADEDVGLQLLTTQSTIEPLCAVVIVSARPKHFTKVLKCRPLLGEGERCCIMTQAVQSSRLAGHAFNQHPNGHAGREAMRVEQDVGTHATFSKGHVLGRPQAAQDALLSMAAGKFITNGGISWHSCSDAHAFKLARASIITTHLYIVNDTGLLTPGSK